MTQPAVLESAAALSSVMDMARGRLTVCTDTVRMRVTDMRGVFSNQEACSTLETEGNPTVYEVNRTQPELGDDSLCYASTIVYPGRVGEEYFMTRGHTHAKGSAPEIYLTVRGEGMMLLQTRDGKIQALSMGMGTILYVPGETAHRIVNVGEEALITFAVYPAAAGIDYEEIQRTGFKRIVHAGPESPDLVPNPNYQSTTEGITS
jgi:glucose-6-phosphate isomerase, archaeal